MATPVGNQNFSEQPLTLKDEGLATRYLNAGADYLNEGADYIAGLITPCIRSGYHWLGEGVSSLAEHLCDPAAGKWVEEAWTDPLSTESILRISNVVEKILEKFAHKQPTNYKWLEFIDKSFIGASQQLLDFVSNSNKILRIAPHIKGKVENLSLKNWVVGPRKALGPIWWVVEGVFNLLKQALFGVIYAVLKVIDYFMPFLSYSGRPKAFKALLTMSNSLMKHHRDHLADAAGAYIEKEETKIRKEIVENAANAALDYTVSRLSRIALKGTLGVLLYYGANFLVQNIGLADSRYLIDGAAVTIAVASIWQGGIQPSLQPYYDSYKEGFSKNAYTLLDYCHDNDIPELYNYFKAFKGAWKGE